MVLVFTTWNLPLKVSNQYQFLSLDIRITLSCTITR
ncbi:hypothetical protein vBSenM1_72 [Salmonella phage vB_SenM-1]|uniref:Uncharacterized protein n=1 Tax=Salmonella phage vB_SenM-1 TaxID=2732255 RepID=A0A6M4BCE0_9CAUD|nr:hypothetical protein vBSenM1_72 [Salmonella phage vB_SenM-1]